MIIIFMNIWYLILSSASFDGISGDFLNYYLKHVNSLWWSFVLISAARNFVFDLGGAKIDDVFIRVK